MAIIFTIFKFIILFMLGILLLTLFLIALILFFPFQYRVRVDILNTAFETDIYFSWLFRLIQYQSVRTEGENKKVHTIKVFGIETKKIRFFKKRTQNKNKVNNIPKKTETINEKGKEPTIADKKPSNKIENEKKYDTETDRESIFTRIQAIIEKIRYFIDYPDRDEIFRYSLVLVKRLYDKNKPKKQFISGEIGFSAPDTTGKCIGFLSMIQAFIPLSTNIIGNFEEEIIKFNIVVQGRLILWNILLPLAQYIFAKPIWKIVKNIFFKNKRKEEVYV